MLLTNPILYRGKTVSYDQLKNSSKIPLIFECECCHKPFKTTKFQIIRNGHEMCQSCAIRSKLGKPIAVGERFNRLVVVAPSKLFGYSVCKCDCGATLSVKNEYLLSGHTKSCGCLQKEAARKNIKRAHKSGEEHPNWKGGVSSEWSRFSVTSAYREWREEVIKQSGNKCVKCGNVENLQAHHIASFAANPSIRDSVDNGICLCESCHKFFHRKYGKKYNNREQLTDFLSTN